MASAKVSVLFPLICIIRSVCGKEAFYCFYKMKFFIGVYDVCKLDDQTEAIKLSDCPYHSGLYTEKIIGLRSLADDGWENLLRKEDDRTGSCNDLPLEWLITISGIGEDDNIWLTEAKKLDFYLEQTKELWTIQLSEKDKEIKELKNAMKEERKNQLSEKNKEINELKIEMFFIVFVIVLVALVYYCCTKGGKESSKNEVS